MNECPFSYIRTIELDYIGSVLISDSENKVFQLTGESTICHYIKVFDTAEGFQLTTDHTATGLSHSHNDLKVIDNLLLTEMDFNRVKDIELIISVFRSTNQKLCQFYKSFLNMYTKLDDEFINFADFNGNEAVFYSDDGHIFVPQCYIINEITIINSTEECYKDIPIQFELNNKSLNAFLTQEKIVRLTSKTTNCKSNRQHIRFNSNKSIIKQNNVVYLYEEPVFKTINYNLQNSNISNINFMIKHDNILINSINIINETINILVKNENTGILHIVEDNHSETNSTIKTILKKIQNLNNTVADLVHNIILYVLVAVTSAVVIFICIAISKKN